jgi:hypothetical protein
MQGHKDFAKWTIALFTQADTQAILTPQVSVFAINQTALQSQGAWQHPAWHENPPAISDHPRPHLQCLTAPHNETNADGQWHSCHITRAGKRGG